MPGAVTRFGVLVALTAALLPVQWIAVQFAWPLRRRLPSFYHRCVIGVLGLRVREIGRRVKEHPLLIVSNHASWLDISVITSVAPVVFVAKREIASWPLFGLLAKLQRSVFVDREKRHATAAVNGEIAQRLAEGDPVLLFGEGTASDGNRVLPFRTALLGAAHHALASHGRMLIQPLSIAYTGLHGLPMGRQHRPRAAWYGRLALLPHLVQVARQGAIDVVVTWGEPIVFDEGSERKAVARRLESTVRRLTTLALRGRPAPAFAPPAQS